MEVISSIYNSGYNIKKFYLGSRELNLAYLGNQVIYDEVIGDSGLNYILYEFYGSDTLPNTVEAPVKSAILKGNTKYRDIDTGDILDTFDETKNLELVSVKMPVLTTSNGDGTKTNILSASEDVVLCGIGEARDELDLMTGEVVQSVGEIVLDGSDDEEWRLNWGESENYIGFQLTANIPNVKGYSSNQVSNLLPRTEYVSLSGKDYEWFVVSHTNTFNLKIAKNKLISSNVDGLKRYLSINPLIAQYQLAEKTIKTVDLTIVDQDGKTINKLNSFNGTTHVSTEVAENSTYPMVSLEVASELQAAMSKVAEDIELIKPVQNDIETTLDTQSNDIDSLLLATTELFEMFL